MRRGVVTERVLRPIAGPPPGTDPALLALVQRAGDGDEEAMHQVMLRTIPRVRNAVRYLVRGDFAEDLVQDALVTILQRLHSFRGDGRFEAWVDGVTLRVVLGRSRRQRKIERREPPIEGEDVVVLRQPDRYATARQLVRALDTLPGSQREAVVMHHVFGLTAQEIASSLEVPHETVRSRLRAGMGQLRARLGVDGGGEA